MPSNFPTGIDTFSAKKVIDLEDALEAVEAKLGVDGSAVATTVDKKLATAIADVATKADAAATTAALAGKQATIPPGTYADNPTPGTARTAVVTATDQTIAGVKTFSAAPLVPDAAFPQAKVASLVADLAARPLTADLHVNMVPATAASPSATRLALQALLNGGGVMDFGKRTYIIDQELEIRVDNSTLHLEGATIQGPVAGTTAGGLLSVVDRSNPTRVVKNVTIIGGLFLPKYAAGDNGLCAVAAHNLLIIGAKVDNAAGLRGVAIQTDATFTGGSGKPLRDVRVVDIDIYGGGTNGLNVESAGGNLISGVSVSGVKVRGASTAVRVSAGGSSYEIAGLVMDGVEIDGAATGITWAYAKKSKLLNVLMRAITTTGIDATNTDDNQWSGITILGPAATGNAIAYTNGTHASITDVDIQGSFAIALYNGMVADLSASDIKIKGATTGIHTTGATQRSSYRDFIFESVATKINAVRSGDVYHGFAERTGTVLTPYSVSAANPDTSGATLAALETEVNQLKATLRAYGQIGL